MFIKLLHRIVQHPWVYDQVQIAAGMKQIRRRLLPHTQALSHGIQGVLDVGGGTGLWRNLWPVSCRYICLDLDILKLSRFQDSGLSGSAIRADALHIPFGNGAVDVVTCMCVSHHLPAASFEQLLQESGRVLKSTGIFVFFDPVWDEHNWAGRLLWKCDRGSNPYPAERLRSLISKYYTIAHDEEFVVYHRYLFCKGIKHSP